MTGSPSTSLGSEIDQQTIGDFGNQGMHRFLALLYHVLDFVAIGYTAVSRVVPFPMPQHMQTVRCRLALDKRWLVIYDHRHGYSWSVVGTR